MLLFVVIHNIYGGTCNTVIFLYFFIKNLGSDSVLAEVIFVVVVLALLFYFTSQINAV